MNNTFISQIHPPLPLLQPALWFIFHGEEILLQNNTIPLLRDAHDTSLHLDRQFYLGMYGSTPCFTAEIDQKPESIAANFRFQSIRQAHELLADEDLFRVLCGAKQLVYWDKSTQFCGYCGQRTQTSDKERAKICQSCKTLVFPHISPAMLVLIWRDDEILLARPPHFLPETYSILAGFVEPGETLEQTVIREVKEEVNLNIKNLHYFSSQPWPFQSNLMLGFIAEYDSGEIQVDTNELEDAQWFSIHKLPKLPKPISLSRLIIDTHLTKQKK